MCVKGLLSYGQRLGYSPYDAGANTTVCSDAASATRLLPSNIFSLAYRASSREAARRHRFLNLYDLRRLLGMGNGPMRACTSFGTP